MVLPLAHEANHTELMKTESTTAIEVIRPDFPRGGFRAALFDFDGTLSLIRRNWQAVMIPMMVDTLAATGTDETREQLEQHVEEFVMRLNGKQTIYQMIQLAEEVTKRGGAAKEPLEYKNQYHDLLWQQVEGRIEGLTSGTLTRDEMTIPETHRLLDYLQERGIELFLASGTDVKYVQDEVRHLGLDKYFGVRVYGALDDYKKFSKAMIIQKIIEDMGMAGEQIVGFGDGYVEIEEIRRVGGVAIGVASEEETRVGVNQWKRQRLTRAGADIIIGDYRCQDELLKLLEI
jgi:phosphoglycolate phosphatase-like HAD superfamily hydrolase